MAALLEEFSPDGQLIWSANDFEFDLHVTGPNSLGIDMATKPGDANYVIKATDRFVTTSAALTETRIWRLPAADKVPPGFQVTIADNAGVCDIASYYISIRAASTINGGAGGGSRHGLFNPYGYMTLRSDGVLNWQIVDSDPGGVGSGMSGLIKNLTMTGLLTAPAADVTLANGNNNNIATTGTFTRIHGPTGAFAVTGITPTFAIWDTGSAASTTYDGQLIILFNTAAQTMTLSHASGSSSVGHQIFNPTGGDIAITGPGAAILVYNFSGYGDLGWFTVSHLP